MTSDGIRPSRFGEKTLKRSGMSSDGESHETQAVAREVPMQVVRMSRRPPPRFAEKTDLPLWLTRFEDSGRTVDMRTLTATRGCAVSNSFTTGTGYFYRLKLSSAA
ncbi:hypothetical protein EMCRGX_G002545 [Ephydatia muelleri]